VPKCPSPKGQAGNDKELKQKPQKPLTDREQESIVPKGAEEQAVRVEKELENGTDIPKEYTFQPVYQKVS